MYNRGFIKRPDIRNHRVRRRIVIYKSTLLRKMQSAIRAGAQKACDIALRAHSIFSRPRATGTLPVF
jgi:hypothetical protein